MTPSQVRYAARKYAARLAAAGAAPVRQDTSSLSFPESVRARMDHAAYMCSEIEGMGASGKMDGQHGLEKAMRWLGFVQGVLWASGLYTIDDMKDDNRSAKVRSAPPASGG